ncbi:transposase [Streptomyces asoensis]
MKKSSGSYPRVRVEGGGRGVVAQAGAVLPVKTVRKVGFCNAISAALTPWRKPRAVHDPGKILLDVALAVALGGDCLADVGMLRSEPAVVGPVASDPTISRPVDALAASGPKALAAIRGARSEVRQRVCGSVMPSASNRPRQPVTCDTLEAGLRGSASSIRSAPGPRPAARPEEDRVAARTRHLGAG